MALFTPTGTKRKQPQSPSEDEGRQILVLYTPVKRMKTNSIQCANGQATPPPPERPAAPPPSYTPVRPTTGHAYAIQTRYTTNKAARKRARKEAAKAVDTYLRRDIRHIADIALPDDTEAQSAAMHASGIISELVHRLVENRHKKSYAGIIREALQDGSDESSEVADGDIELLAAYAALFRLWIKGAIGLEADMYQPIISLFGFVAKCIECLQSRLKVQPVRRIDSFKNTGRKPKDSTDGLRVDIILKLGEAGGAHQRSKAAGGAIEDGNQHRDLDLSYEDAFAIVEVKADQPYARNSAHGKPRGLNSVGKEAMAQLFQYSKNVYPLQHNRRFLWGMTVCRTVASPCVLGPNFALASRGMDLSTKRGIRDLVRLVVRWSFCDEHRLSYDPTIRLGTQKRYLEIDVPRTEEDGTQVMQTFYSRNVIVVAERLFGRHTRCFVASDEPPPEDSAVPWRQEFIIKDAWTEVPGDGSPDTRDEAVHLARITKKLGQIKDNNGRPKYEGMYPEWECGGRMPFQCAATGGDDTTAALVGPCIWHQLRRIASRDPVPREPPLRAHKRICTKGVGRPFKTIESVPELISVVADVMECHTAILERCGILHRDLSTSNILVRCDENERARGMLIDFDHAIRIDGEGHVPHAERTGTWSFLSVNNLENVDANRHPASRNNAATALDDWESLIYILCWVGTFGWDSKMRALPDMDVEREIDRWDTAGVRAIAETKRMQLETTSAFRAITDQFLNVPGREDLQRLVKDLHWTLVCKHRDENSRGMEIKPQAMSSSDGFQMDIDPIGERAGRWREISKDLLGVVQRAAEAARE